MTSTKYYVVWRGYAPGVYDSWEEAEIQVSGYPDASYRSFKTQEAAIEAFREGYDREGLVQDVQRELNRMSQEGTCITFDPEKPAAPATPKADKPQPTQVQATITPAATTAPAAPKRRVIVQTPPPYCVDAIAVDAACSGNPGPMEYRGVLVRTGQQLFRVGPLQRGTNNIGEFLAIVHGMAMQEKQGTCLPLYSDSVNAQIWVRQGVCKTKLEECEENAPLFELVRRAEQWLRTHSFRVPVYKWETKQWGEIPADFGRK